MFGERILSDWDAIAKSLAACIAIPSVRSAAEEGMPFGAQSTAALQYMLHLAETLGLKTENVGNYAGHAEYGLGEETDAVLTHVDVVPAGDGWKTEPFVLTKEDNLWIGRGVADNKGCAIVALYCLKALKDAGVLGKRKMRVIFGAGEETGSNDMAEYFAHQPLPKYAFTPDADYTVCNREKGILQVEFSCKEDAPHFWAGEAVNAVPGRADCVFAGTESEADALRAAAKAQNIDAHIHMENGNLTVSVNGIPAHAMEPHLGKNAATTLFAFLRSVRGTTGSKLCDWMTEKVGFELNGETIGVACADEPSGALTFNVGTVRTEDGITKIRCDLRYPVTVSGDAVAEILRKEANEAGFDFVNLRDHQPLYLPENSPLIRLLCDAYEAVTGQKSVIYATGGGTYARELKGRGVAFGAIFPDAKSGGMHTAGEHMDIDEFKLHAQVCLEAMYRMMLAD